MLSEREFCVAMHLVVRRTAGDPIPTSTRTPTRTRTRARTRTRTRTRTPNQVEQQSDEIEMLHRQARWRVIPPSCHVLSYH